MPVRRRLSSKERIELLERVTKDGVPVAQACRSFGVSRFTFYRLAKRYLPSLTSQLNLELLADRYRKGQAHYRKLTSQDERAVLEHVRLHPSLSTHKLAEHFPRIGNHGIQTIFKEFHLSKRPDREVFSEISLAAYLEILKERGRGFRQFLDASQRYLVLQRVLGAGDSVSQVCRETGISRFTFYQWLKQFREDKSQTRIENRWRSGASHYRAIPQDVEKLILKSVIREPLLSSHGLAARIPQVGNHGVQNILRRHHLSNSAQRLEYSRIHGEGDQVLRPAAGWEGRPKQVLEEFVPGLAPAPPPGVSPFFQVPVGTWLRRFAPYFFLSLLLLIGLYGWGYLLGSAQTPSQVVGFTFASIALSMGSVFFLYSLKYYFTLAVVLSFSREADAADSQKLSFGQRKAQLLSSMSGGWLSRLFGIGAAKLSFEEKKAQLYSSSTGGLEPDLTKINLDRHPFISVHLPMYNEKLVAERILRSCTSFDYFSPSGQAARYEVVVADDSTDETTGIVERFLQTHGTTQEFTGEHGNRILKVHPSDPGAPSLTLIHRADRAGFKGGALREALRVSDPRAEFIVVFDADFVPYPDTLELFLKYFQVNSGSLDFRLSSLANDQRPTTNVAAIQGYQWHVLNKSENWITRGVRSEYAGSYVIERSGAELYGGLKQIAGSVYMIRRDLLDTFGWGTSITEDFQLTLKLYEQGYKVVYTPYIQAPAECASTLKRLIRQRMRWAEGHSFNIRKMFMRLLFGGWGESAGEADQVNNEVRRMNNGLNSHDSSFMIHDSKDSQKQGRVWRSSPLSLSEKLEFLYLSPYYLQAAFFLLGTICWLLSETVYRARLPFWTNVWGWSLVLTNLISLPLMNMVGLFLEEAEEKDFAGILSFVLLTYILIPFQAYASVKGFIEREEGPWFRTPKTGRITDVLTRGRFYRFIRGIFPRLQPDMRRAAIGGQAGHASEAARGIAARVPASPASLGGIASLSRSGWPFGIQPLTIQFPPRTISVFGLHQRRRIGRSFLVGLLISTVLLNYLSYFAPNPVYAYTAAWYNQDWGYRKPIIIDDAQVIGTADLSYFPVLINRTDTDWKDTGNGGHVGQSDGGDILFTSSNGTSKLDHEIEEYTASSGELVAWVEVPTLDYNDDTILYIYYGNASVADQWNITGTWDDGGSNYFKGVWHFGESSGTNAEDSTSSGFDGTAQDANSGNGDGDTPPPVTAGNFGNARSYDGTDDLVNVGDQAGLELTTFTLEAWVYRTGSCGTFINCNIISKGQSGNTGFAFRVHGDDSYKGSISLRDSLQTLVGTTILSVDTWYHIVATINGSTVIIYLDGASENSASQTVTPTYGTEVVKIGNANNNSDLPWQGKIDEVRISSIDRDANWISTQFNNQDAPSTFYSVGSEDSGNPGIEQQINIIDQEYSTANTTAQPTDNSLGLVNWDADDYNGEAVYFEAVIRCVSCTGGGNLEADATLYTEAGSAVTGGTVSTTSTSYARVRSSAITANLVDGTDYTVRLARDATTGGTAYVKAARLIIVQSDATMLTNTAHHVEIGNEDQMFGARVQRGPVTFGASSTATATLGQTVDTTRSFILCSKTSDANDAPDDMTAMCQLTDGDTVTFTRTSTTGTPTFHYEVIEYDNIKVQTDSVSFGTTDTTINYGTGDGLEAVDLEKTFVFYSAYGGGTSQNDNADVHLYAQLTSSTNVSFTRSQTGTAVTAAFSVVEFLDDTYVEQVAGLTIANTATTDDSNALARQVAVDRSFVVGHGGGSSTGDLGMDSNTHVLELIDDGSDGDYDDVRATRIGTTAAGDLPIGAWVIELPENGTNVQPISATNWSACGTTITLGEPVDLNRSFVWGLTSDDGGGQDYQRAYVDYYLTDEDTVSLDCVVATNNDQFRGYVVQLPDWRDVTDPKIYTFDSTKFSGTLAANFEGTLRSSESTASASLRLYNITDSETVTSSTVTVSGTTWDRQVSSSLTIGASAGNLKSGDEYIAQLSYESGVETQSANAKLVLTQSDVGGLTSMEIIHTYVNTLTTDTDSTYTEQDFDNQYDDSHFAGGTYTFRHECTLKSSAGTGYCDMYNGSAQITNSEITTDGTDDNDYDRIRGGSNLTGMPVSATNIDARLRNSAASGNTTSVSNSWLIITVTSLQIPERLLFAVPLVLLLPYLMKRRKRLANRSNWRTDGNVKLDLAGLSLRT